LNIPQQVLALAWGQARMRAVGWVRAQDSAQGQAQMAAGLEPPVYRVGFQKALAHHMDPGSRPEQLGQAQRLVMVPGL
jgi:hypothetical protein